MPDDDSGEVVFVSRGSDDDAVTVPRSVADSGNNERDVGWVRYPDDTRRHGRMGTPSRHEVHTSLDAQHALGRSRYLTLDDLAKRADLEVAYERKGAEPRPGRKLSSAEGRGDAEPESPCAETVRNRPAFDRCRRSARMRSTPTRKDDLMIALAKAAATESQIVADDSGDSAGFLFADEVATRLLPDDRRAGATTLREGVMAAARFSMAAVREYIGRQSPEAFMTIDSPPG